MDKAKLGTATAFGMFDAIYQLIAGLVLILYCSKQGGIPYGIAFIVSALASGTFVILARKKDWARKTVLLLGLAQIFAIFFVATGLELIIPNGNGIASNGILMLRSIAFYTGITLLISGVMFYPVNEYDRGKFILGTSVYKGVTLIGAFLALIVPALLHWQKVARTAFGEWIVSFGGENPDQALLLDQFEMWVDKWNPVLEGIGVLLLALLPTYLWFLDGFGLFFKEKTQKKSIILTAVAAPFLIGALVTLVLDFVETKKLALLIFAILTVLVCAGAWACFYILPKKMGWLTQNTEELEDVCEADGEKEPVAETVSAE